MSEAKERQEWDQGVYGLVWCHTVYGGDDLDSMMQCELDDPKAQTVGVIVQMTPDRENPVNFHMNVDRLGRVDPQDGQRVFDLNVEAARLFVAAPDLLAVVESLAQHDTRNASQSLHKLALRAREAINKTKGGAK